MTNPDRTPSAGTPATGPVRVRPAEDGDAPAWDRYVDSARRATVLHRSAWRRVLRQTFRYADHSMIAERDGAPVGVLPLFACRSIKGSLGLYSSPHSVYGGPVGDDEEAEKALLDAARGLAATLGARTLDLRNRYATHLDLPLVEGFVTFEKTLPDDPADVYRTFPKKAREAINQARKRHGLSADLEDDLGLFYDLLAASFHNLGTPVFPKRMFEAILEEFGTAATMLIVRHEGAPVSGVLSLAYRDTIHPLYSGEAPGVRNLKSNNFKYFRLMEIAVEAGLRRFDFGRSRLSNEGAVRFKRNQGFEDEALPYQAFRFDGREFSAPSPQSGMFGRVRKVWSRMPLRLATAMGPAIVRYFP